MMRQGQIYKIHSDFYYIESGVDLFECKVREVLKKRREKILVGDIVNFANGYIEEILPRKNFIARPSVSNIDQVIIVSALKEPNLDLHQLNRYIALAKYYKIDTVLCFNKDDLETDDVDIKRIFEIYEPLGFKIVFTSAVEHHGLMVFKEILQNKVSVLCGNSGVGKSSLINAINPDLNLRTKAVSEKLQRGTHTTRHCEIIKLDNYSKIVDTPGFSNVRFDFILPADVGLLFDEIARYSSYCKYGDCLHINEDGCAVLDNIDTIADSRYESYLEFIKEAKEYKERLKNEGKKVELSKKMLHNREVTKISDKKRQTSRRKSKQEIYKDLIDNENE